MNNTNVNSESRSSGINLTSGSSNKSKSSQSSNNNVLKSSQLMKLFHNELKDIYWAEKALTKAMPKMIKNAGSEELAHTLKSHLSETETQVSRVEQVFESIGKKNTTKKCEAMDGLIKEAEEIMENCEEGPMRDAGIIAAAQKVEHYEIATYGTLRYFAEKLGLNRAVELLQSTLNEEKSANNKLTEVAINIVSIQAN